jgi:hypothetical protein
MRHLARVSLLIPLFLGALLASGLGPRSAAPKKDYFTEDELDLIRDAQELALRAPLYFKLAERRLVFLGLMQQNEKEKEKERKEQQRRLKEQQKAGNIPTTQKPPEDPMAYLADFTRSELLRGYTQAIDEVMTNIDDAYSRKLDVRNPLEDLEKFLRETMPLVEKFQPKNDTERAAMDDAMDKAKEALNSTKDALGVVPKTEKKRK